MRFLTRGADLSSTGEYIQLLVSRSFMTFGSLLRINEGFARARLHCRFAPTLMHFIPDSQT